MGSPNPLPSEDLAVWLDGNPNWALKDGALERRFRFRNFAQAFAFMTTVADAAEALDHHPDWWNCWNQVRVRLWTHEADAITTLDLALAAACDSAAEKA